MIPYYFRLKDLRVEHGLLQKEVAAVLKIHTHVYGKYERGEQNIPSIFVAMLADTYSTSMDYILERTNNPAPYSGRGR